MCTTQCIHPAVHKPEIVIWENMLSMQAQSVAIKLPLYICNSTFIPGNPYRPFKQRFLKQCHGNSQAVIKAAFATEYHDGSMCKTWLLQLLYQ